MTLDLNNPQDAREFLLSWYVPGQMLPRDELSDEECLRLAMQIFLFCDPNCAPEREIRQ